MPSSESNKEKAAVYVAWRKLGSAVDRVDADVETLHGRLSAVLRQDPQSAAMPSTDSEVVCELSGDMDSTTHRLEGISSRIISLLERLEL